MNKAWTVPPPQPDIPTGAEVADTTSLTATMYSMERVRIVVAFDRDENNLVTLANPTSARLFELLWQLCRQHGYVMSMQIRDRDIEPRALVRLNWFLHIHGYTRGFWAWRIARMKVDGGHVMWKCAAAWNELKIMLKL